MLAKPGEKFNTVILLTSRAGRGSGRFGVDGYDDELLMLKRADAVETTGEIRPLRVTEIGFAVRKNFGLHRLPIQQVRAAFHHDDQVRGAGDVESEFIRLDAKHAITRLRLWIP